MKIDPSLSARKQDLFNYFRGRASEALAELKSRYGDSITRTTREKLATEINKSVAATRGTLIHVLLQKSSREDWTSEDILQCILLITYTSYVAMIEYRHEVWPYEYMAFSRRIGELWELFCKLCFEYPVQDINLFIPPLFSDFRQKLISEIETYIEQLNITEEQKADLKSYYSKVWALVTSGEINLQLDLHFEQGGQRFVVDFKSGFGSNEKGNTNRLLLVATIYKNLAENYRCLLLVRSAEDSNNHYFQILKRSQVWEAYCGDEAYRKISEYSGFDIRQWIADNVAWLEDLNQEIVQYLQTNSLTHYLAW